MRVLLISERDADYRLIAGLLKSLGGDDESLSWCRADVTELGLVPVADCDVILWGDVSDMASAMQLLGVLDRQTVVPPIVVITDDVKAAVGNDDSNDNYDILPRSELTAELLSHAMRKANVPLPSTAATLESTSPDPLTGLSNRHAFREQLAEVLEHTDRANSVGLLLIDVDQFKKVNASYGQGAGDALIQLIAERIRECLSPNQRLARIGGNEFAVVFQSAVASVEEEIRQRVDKIAHAMAKPFPVAQHAVRMHISMGVVINSDTSINVDQMLSHADMAMRIAKQDKGSTCQFYTKDMTDSAQQVLKLEGEIRRGLRKEEFELHFQPRIDIGRNRIVGAEALVRWRHPTRGLLAPGEFIAIAEDSGLIVPLGYWIIHNACKQLNILAEKGYPEVQIAVNVAFKQFQDRNFVRTVANILQKHGIGPGRLEFELTETTMMVEGQSVDESLRKLSQLGIDISLDDFGTGYSSFAHIQRLPISALKVDRTFVSSATVNDDDATIVKAIINLAHSLNMQVIAEGAETIEQVAFLTSHRCDQIQGYYFSRPVTFTDLQKLLLREDFVDHHIQDLALTAANS